MTTLIGSARPTRRRCEPSTDGAAARRIVFYEGERIYFRPIEPEDEPRLREWINDPRNWRFLHHRPPTNGPRELEWVQSLAKGQPQYVFGIVVKDGDRLIGVTGLHNPSAVDRKATVGIAIGDPASQNKGYGTEAVRLLLRYGFEELNLNRIGLTVFANNPRAIRCYQKAGFVQEGYLRQAAYRNGQFHDEYLFAVLREEWEANRQRWVETG
jgi:RimJ/RimL family protein N-acetyltransferase